MEWEISAIRSWYYFWKMWFLAHRKWLLKGVPVRSQLFNQFHQFNALILIPNYVDVKFKKEENINDAMKDTNPTTLQQIQKESSSTNTLTVWPPKINKTSRKRTKNSKTLTSPFQKPRKHTHTHTKKKVPKIPWKEHTYVSKYINFRILIPNI